MIGAFRSGGRLPRAYDEAAYLLAMVGAGFTVALEDLDGYTQRAVYDLIGARATAEKLAATAPRRER